MISPERHRQSWSIPNEGEHKLRAFSLSAQTEARPSICTARFPGGIVLGSVGVVVQENGGTNRKVGHYIRRPKRWRGEIRIARSWRLRPHCRWWWIPRARFGRGSGYRLRR